MQVTFATPGPGLGQLASPDTMMVRTLRLTSSFAASLERLNGWVADLALRRYQREIIESGKFEVSSPFRQGSCPLSECLLLESDLIAYLFRAEQFCLLVGPQHEGYPLASLLCLESGALWRGMDGQWDAGSNASISAESLSLRDRIQELGHQEPDLRPHALFGDGNFAHLVWNGLGALRAVEGLDTDLSQIRFVSRCDPLGDPRAFLRTPPSLACDAWSERADLHGGRRFKSATFLGSCFIPEDLAASVVAVCHARSSESARLIRARLNDQNRRALWISLRQRRRDCTNQVAFVAELVSQVLQRSDTVILLDGFSLPDCEIPEFFADYVARVDDAFREILEVCPPLAAAMSAGRAFFFNGVPLYDAISLASAADFYVCHGGTQQHKIGWFYPTPGVIHLPNPSESVQDWYSAQSAVSSLPACVPESAINVDGSGTESLAEASYQIDLVEGVDFVLRRLASTFGRPSKEGASNIAVPRP